MDQPEDQRQQQRQDDAAGQGKVDPPIAAAELEIARQTEQSDLAEQDHEQAEHENCRANRHQPFAELLWSEVHRFLMTRERAAVRKMGPTGLLGRIGPILLCGIRPRAV